MRRHTNASVPGVLCLCVLLSLAAGCADSKYTFKSPASLRVVASDPSAQVIAVDWLSAGPSLLRLLPAAGPSQADASDSCVPLAADWRPDALFVMQATASATAQQSKGWETWKKGVVTGSGELTINGHLDGILAIARKGDRVAAADVGGQSDALSGSYNGFLRVRARAPEAAAANGKRVPPEGLRLQLPLASDPPNAIVFENGFLEVIAIDGKSTPRPLVGMRDHREMYSLSPGTHTLRLSYSSPTNGGRLYLIHPIEATFAAAPGHVLIIDAIALGSKLSVIVYDATELGKPVTAQCRSVR